MAEPGSGPYNVPCRAYAGGRGLAGVGAVLKAIDHVVLTVADIAATERFYADALGVEAVGFGEGRRALRVGDQKINLHTPDQAVDLKARHPTRGSGDLCFLTDRPLAEVIARLERCGIAILAGPTPRMGASGPMMSVYFRDPDENLVEVSNYEEAGA